MKVEGGLSESGFSGLKDEQDDAGRLFYPVYSKILGILIQTTKSLPTKISHYETSYRP